MRQREFRWAAWLLILALVLTVPAGAFSQEPSAWAAADVAAAQEAGLVPETLEGDYNAPITRAEFCALAAQLYRVWDGKGQTADKAAPDVSFTDCDDPDVLLCASLGVVNGVGDGKFNPDAPIRRQDAAAMLHRLAALQKGFDDAQVLPHVFDDGADLRSWARSDVYWAYANGVMQGVGENRFAPDGSYTREQSILTMLRLYDSDYAQPPEPEAEPEPPYHVVWDMVGPGARRVHLEDAEGNRLLTDFADTDGYFYLIEIFGEGLSLYWNEYSNHAIYMPKTGKVLEGYMIDGFEEKSGLGWCWKDGMAGIRTVIHADGTLGGTYLPAGGWDNGRVLVLSDSRTVSCLDGNETVLWSRSLPGTVSLEDCQGIGDRMVLQMDETYYLLDESGLTALPKEVDYAIPLRWTSNCIGVEPGKSNQYTLYDRNGNALAGPFSEELREVGQDLYSYRVGDRQYAYFRCVPGGKPTDLFTVDTVSNAPGDLLTDGGGVYALPTDDREITCFDRFGDILGVIEMDFDNDIYTDITFEGGCVRVEHTYATEDAPEQSALYLPTGEKIG